MMVSTELDDLIIGSPITTVGSDTVRVRGGHGDEGGEPGPVEQLQLSLADLLPDSEGVVVLFAGEGVLVRLATHTSLLESGVSDSFVTAAGIDVTGHHFYSFENGVTVYSESDVLVSEPA
jgi:hypothetical protein